MYVLQFLPATSGLEQNHPSDGCRRDGSSLGYRGYLRIVDETAPKSGPRSPAALITSERRMSETWNEAVLKILRKRQDVMPLQEIYEGMENHPLVTPHHKQYEYGQPSYHNYIRSILAKLKRSWVVCHVGRARYIASERRMSETWNEAVLNVLRRRQAVMSLQEIYEGMENHPLVTPHHKQYSHGQPNYHHWIRSSLRRLKVNGAVRHVSHSRYIAN